MKHFLNLLLLPLCCAFLTINAIHANTAPINPPYTNPPDENLLTLTLSLQTDLLCHDDNNGVAVVLAVGGTPPYLYTWAGGGIGPIGVGLSAGLHTVTVTDLFGAQATLDVFINAPAELLVNVAAEVDINCLNINGSATVNASGGTGSSLYLWSNGQVGPTATNLTAGLYTVTATDQNGCTSLQSVNITTDLQLPTVNVDLNADLQIDCNSPLVSLDASASTGGSNLAYLWTTVNGNINTGNNSNIASVSAAGTYLLQVTNTDNGCTNTQTVNVTADLDLPVINVAANLDLQLDCLTPTLNLDVVAATGLSYLWATVNGNILSGGNTNSPTVNQPGVYVVVATDLLSGCTNTSTVTVTADLDLPVINVAANLDLQLDCLTPTLNLDVVAATGLSYLWATVNGNILSGGNTNSPTVNQPGVYVVVATDLLSGCTSTSTVTVTADLDLPVINVAANLDLQLDCLTPTLNLDIAAATGLSYLWATVNGNILSGGNTNSPTVNQPGVYVVVATDLLSGCTNTSTVTVTADLDLPVIDVAANLDLQLDCLTPTINLDVVAATGLSYLWATVNGNILSGGNTNSPTVNQPGVYVVVATDLLSGCTNTASVTVTVDADLPIIDIDLDVDLQLDCNTSLITLDASASTSGPNIVYLWATVDGHILSGGNSNSAIVDEAGVYVLVVTNLLTGCTNTASVTVTIGADLPTAAIEIGANVDLQLDCTTSQITLNASASAAGPGITYLWTTINGNILSGGNTTNPVVNQAGTYVLVVLNTNTGCSATASVVVTVDASLPTATIEVGANVNLQLSCTTSQITLNASASAAGPGITYLWTTINGNIVSGGNTTNPVVNQAGTYVLVVTNTNTGCSATASVIITADASLPTATIEVGANVNLQLSCTTSQITLNASASAAGPGITYLWTTVNGNIVSGGNTTNPVVNQAGTYVLVVTNTNTGCSATTSVNVTADIAIPVVSIEAGIGIDLQLDCLSPQITLNATASTSGPNIIYSWTTLDGNIVSGSNGLNAVVNAAGTYVLVVTNSLTGCSNTASVTVTADVNLPVAQINVGANVDLQIDCSSPQITLDASGSTSGPGITYLWTTVNGNIVGGTNTTSLTVNAAGTYVLQLTNTNTGCTVTTSVVVTTDVTVPVVSATVNGELGCSASTLVISGNVSSPGTFSYLWSTGNGNIVTGANTLSATVNAAGTYNLLVTNTSTGCTATTSVTVTGNPTLNVSVTGMVSVSCFGSQNGSATINVTGGTAPYAYQWSNGMTSASVSGLAAGSYLVTVTDVQGCQSVLNITITQPAPLTASAATTPASGPGQSNGTATVNVNGGTAPYAYQWSNGMTSSSVNGLTNGTYTVLVTDAQGCSTTITVVVGSSDPGCALAIAVTVQPTTCGQATGQANVMVINGMGSLTYQWSNGMTTATVLGLAAGTYIVTVTDTQGCSSSTTAVIIGNNDIMPPVVIVQNATIYIGANGQATLSPSTIDNGSFDACGPIILAVNVTSFDCESVGPQTVVLTATDQSGNTSTATATVTVVGNGETNLTCPSNITVINGGSVVTFDLPSLVNGCDNTALSTPILVGGMGSGSAFSIGTTKVTYIVVGTGPTVDTCSFTVTIITTQLVVDVDVQSPSCPGSTDGTATVNVSGGVSPYSYLWVETGEMSPTATGLSAGQYHVVVIDSMGTVYTQIITVNDPTALNVNITSIVDNCNGNGFINVTVTGGTGPYIYNWYDINGNVFAITEDLIDVPSGTYVLVVTDANGCSFNSGPIVVDFVSGTSETELSTAGIVSLAPNPVSNEPVILSLNLPEASPIRVETYNMSGQQVGPIQQGEFQKGQFTLTFGNFAPGQYLVKVITEERTYVKKVIRVQ